MRAVYVRCILIYNCRSADTRDGYGRKMRARFCILSNDIDDCEKLRFLVKKVH